MRYLLKIACKKQVLCLSLIVLLGNMILVSCSKANAAQGESNAWIEDYSQALLLARETGKSILVNFTGSDWCGWCVRLDFEVFSQPEFRAYADENLILLKLDFPQNIPQSAELIAQNRGLLEKYSVQGFPTIVFIDKDEKLLAVTGYVPGGAENYIEHLKELGI